MKYALAATMLAFGLAACGGGGGGDTKAKLVEKCVEDGEDKEACTCQVDALDEALGSDTLKKLAKAADNDDESAAEALMMEVLGEDPEAAMKMGMAMMACGT